MIQRWYKKKEITLVNYLKGIEKGKRVNCIENGRSDECKMDKLREILQQVRFGY